MSIHRMKKIFFTMSGLPNIFICHSSEDHKVVNEFRKHLNPLFCSRDLNIWDDSDLPIGRPWHKGIQDQVKSSVAAIILVSPSLLDSDYVRTNEITIFLELAKDSGLPIYCMYLSFSVVEEMYFFPSSSGSSEGIRLTDYQGLNSPETPLSQLTKKDRNKFLVNSALTILNDLKDRGIVPRGGPRRTVGIVDREPLIGRLTVYVLVQRTKPHPTYGHTIRTRKIIAVHWDESIDLHKDDRVEVRECAPKSRTKKHELIRKL